MNKTEEMAVKRTWFRMKARCYNWSTHKRKPSYIGCTVADEWMRYENFREWMISQDWKGNHLDKDIIKPGNKVYSPETCCFVPIAINNILNKRRAGRGKYPIGVSYDKKKSKYMAQMKRYGKKINLGWFKNEADASAEYKKAKKQYLIDVADSLVDARVKAGLLRHANNV